MKVIYGTTNKNKIKDIQEIVKVNNENMTIFSLKDINFNEEIEENGTTFEENSKIKSEAVKRFCDKNNISYDLIITDDAGLCVDSLNGEPGVYSARYAGENATQEQIINKLLNNMEKAKDKKRTARFVCVLTAVTRTGKIIVSKGECEGTIATSINTLGGLTYAPVFIPKGFKVPMNKLSAEEYIDAHNHRYLAFINLLKQLKNIK